MKIAYPGHPIHHDRALHGYPRRLAAGMMEHYADNDYLVYSTEHPGDDPLTERENCAVRTPARYYANPKAVWRVWGMTAQLRADRPDLYHGLDGTLPLNLRRRDVVSVVTVHDLGWLVYPKLYSPVVRFLRRLRTTAALRHARRVIAVSQYVADQLSDVLHVDKHKIEVIYPAVSEVFGRRVDAARRNAVSRRYKLPERFMVAPEGLQDIHNPELILRALGTPGAKETHMVLTGGTRRERRELRRRAREAGVSSRIHLTGPVDDSTRAALYALADAVVAPGFYAGFPVHVAEAMAAGAPVICSHAGAYAEIAGDAPLLINPEEVRSLAGAIAAITSGEADTERMAARGRERAHHFTSRQMTDSTFFTYLAALEQ